MPTLVMMHGLTGTAELIRPLAESLLAPNMSLILPEAKIPHPKRGFAWWLRDASPSMPLDESSLNQVDQSVELIVKIIKEYSTEGELILGGFSQGAAMATEVFMHPEIYNRTIGLVLIAGKTVRPNQLNSKLLENPIPVVWMHGDTDQIVSMNQAEELCNVIETANCPILKLRHHKGHMVNLKQKNEIIHWIDSVAQ